MPNLFESGDMSQLPTRAESNDGGGGREIAAGLVAALVILVIYGWLTGAFE